MIIGSRAKVNDIADLRVEVNGIVLKWVLLELCLFCYHLHIPHRWSFYSKTFAPHNYTPIVLILNLTKIELNLFYPTLITATKSDPTGFTCILKICSNTKSCCQIISRCAILFPVLYLILWCLYKSGFCTCEQCLCKIIKHLSLDVASLRVWIKTSMLTNLAELPGGSKWS